MSDADKAVRAIRKRCPDAAPQIGMVLGTGLGPLAEGVENATSIPYEDLPGFPQVHVSGHVGALLLGSLEGMSVAILQGRAHYYENGRADAMAVAVQTLKALGCSTLLLTNSAGSLDPEAIPGWPMLLSDHIDYSGLNPLIGTGGDERFVDMSDAYHSGLRERLRQVGAAQGISLAEGVYMWFSGPSFETPAEIRAARTLGADAVGMSTVPEVILARRHGMRVAAISMITNFGAGMTDEKLSHTQTKIVAAQGAERMQVLVRGFLKSLAVDPVD
ncbi:MAG: purine-nucleoside phosphorylase [Hyphomicrobiales bacterium]